MKQVLAGIGLAIACVNCAYDPVTPPHRQHKSRPNPYTNASIDEFRWAVPVDSLTFLRQRERDLRQQQDDQPLRAFRSLKQGFGEPLGPLIPYPYRIENERVIWQAARGYYRMVVNNGSTNFVHSFTAVFVGSSVSVRVPTNENFKLVSP